MNESSDRRGFLETVGVGAAGAISAGFSATAKGYYANETLNVACIVTGGRQDVQVISPPATLSPRQHHT